MAMHTRNLLLLHKSTFCSIVIGNGLLVAVLCLMAADPVLKDCAEQLGTNEAKMERLYLRALVGIGLLVSTITALLALPFLRRAP